MVNVLQKVRWVVVIRAECDEISRWKLIVSSTVRSAS
jgi:hypothetical protein